jgi:arabinogalactan oligomer / maltooligosaccharide transport system permease protein
MSAENRKSGGPKGPLEKLNKGIGVNIFILLGLAVLDGFGLLFINILIQDGAFVIAAPIAVILIVVNIVLLSPKLFPVRWQIPVASILILIVLFPITYTIYSAFTNYSDGHILTKQQAINRLERETFLPEGAETYSFTVFRNPDGEFVLWLVDQEGKSFLATKDEFREIEPGEGIIGSPDVDGIPITIEGYQRLARTEIIKFLGELEGALFGEPPNEVQIVNLNSAAGLQQRFEFNPDDDAIIDRRESVVYFADNGQGLFISPESGNLQPGFIVTIGFENFHRLFASPAFRGPFLRIFAWTIAFALLSVLTTFTLGLLIALVFDKPIIIGRKLIRSLLLVPYTLPGIIGVLIWRGLLNPHLGVIPEFLNNTLGWAPGFFTDPFWAKVAILLINLWLGYPYMMLVSSGAIQAIPTDIYEAAAVDGANAWQKFWRITLPLLLVSVGPLLIASFVFNFNNFAVIYPYLEGRPPMAGTTTPAGHTDILITYTYRIAFEGGRGQDYAYAAAITIVIFIIVATLTLIQYRFTRRWEEVSENV